MRVTIVSRIYDPEPSAASFFLARVADLLVTRGHRVTVITSKPPTGVRIDDPPAIRVLRAPVLRDRRGYLRGYLPYLSFDLPAAFRALVRATDIYLVEPPPTTGAVVRVVAALRRRPYIYDAADVWSDAATMATRSGIVLGVLRVVERFAAKGARGIVTISPGVVERLRSLGVRAPEPVVVGFGADTTEFEYEPHPARERLFVYAGSFNTWHGADVIISAWSEVVSACPDARLLFIGNGSEREALEEQASRSGLPRIEFRDPVPASELAPILRSAIASLATLKPSSGYDYAFTSKIYSALAVGCPVVFAGPGPTNAFLEEAGRHVRAGEIAAYDPSSYASAMLRLAQNPVDETSRESLAAWTAREHSMEAVAGRVVAELEQARPSR